MASSHKAVYAFIAMALRQVFPPEFWGSHHNYAVILEGKDSPSLSLSSAMTKIPLGIRKVVMMRKRETVRIPYILRGFKASNQ